LLARLGLALATTAILTALLFFHLDYYLVENRLERFRLNQPSPCDIRASREISWEDGAERKRLQDEAANNVPFIYMTDPRALALSQDQLTRLFTALRTASPTQAERDVLDQAKVSQEIIQSAHKLTEIPGAMDRLHETARDLLNTVMQRSITEGEAQQQAERQLDTLARQRLQPDVEATTLVSTLTRQVLRPTRVVDLTRTQQAQRQARESISQVIRRYASGDIILRKGDILTLDDFRQLRQNNVLLPLTPLRILPLGLLLLFAVLGIGAYLRRMWPAVYENQRKLILLACLVIIPVWTAITLRGQQEYLVALLVIPAASMIVAGMVGTPAAVLTTLLTSALFGLTSDLHLFIVMLTLASGLTGVMLVSSIWPASRAVPAVAFLSGVNLLLLLCIEELRPGGGLTSWSDVGTMTLWAVASGFGAAIIAVGAIYFFSRLFGITTHYRLMELSSPNQPLLRRMILEAPGSYHSSVMVANIAQAAADAIGADALFTRVAALYHDIGKLKRPAFFVENQAPLGIENAHQRLSPKLSYLILANHVRDGVETGRQYKLPEEIISVIREHHGTTLAAYFYHRALNEGNGEQVVEHDFRYPGPKPTSREAAVVMLADSVQASVKSLKEPTPHRIEAMVQEIVNNRLDDGQLDDCNLTFRDLRMISEVLVRILSRLYTYTRLEYPDIQGTRHRANIHHEKPSAPSEPSAPASGH
jgi:hypothetical protein